MPQVPDRNRCPEESAVTLHESEVDDFLEFLFVNVGRRPAQLTMRECMRVARYLDWLVYAGVPKAAVKKGAKAVQAYRQRLPSEEERDKKWCVKHTWPIFSGDA